MLIGAFVSWCTAWWQLGNVNALLIGLVVALAGWWAIGLLDYVKFDSGMGIVSISDYLPIHAMKQFFLGAGLGLSGVSLWSYKYKSRVSMWLCYALSIIVVLTGFFAVAAAV